ncbi:MAG: protein jag [Armatimonadetes bacterium]|nr:protein jag [Armatimonadota bacterium]MDW8120715.1 RNA-binding cell elongation regulator Jag/EloR [Armatimonadota bacterium]
MKSLEATGKTVQEAIDKGLATLGVSREQVEIEVVSEGTTRFLGVGGEPARVRLTVKLSPAAFVKEFTEKIIALAGWDLKVHNPVEGEGEIYLNMEGIDAGLVIGPKGETLDAFQTIVQSALFRQYQIPTKVVLDAANYREKRRGQVIQMALEAADKARTQKRLVRLRNLSAAERRVVHLTLQSDPTVTTFSEGEGDERVVVVAPAESRQRQRPNQISSGTATPNRMKPRPPKASGSSDRVIE